MIRITIAFIIIGLIVFTSIATFDYDTYSNEWGRIYALWDKGCFCLLGYLIINTPDKRQRKEFLPIFHFLLVRLSWDCISWISGLSVNHPKAVGIFFILYLCYVTYKTVTHVRN